GAGRAADSGWGAARGQPRRSRRARARLRDEPRPDLRSAPLRSRGAVHERAWPGGVRATRFRGWRRGSEHRADRASARFRHRAGRDDGRPAPGAPEPARVPLRVAGRDADVEPGRRPRRSLTERAEASRNFSGSGRGHQLPKRAADGAGAHAEQRNDAMTRVLTFSSLAVLLAGCLALTVNVNFPQEKIDSAASNIEDLVRMPKDAPAPPAPTTPPRSGGAAMLIGLLGPATAEAQAVPELKTRTPEVVAVIDSRRARYPELAAAAAKGCIGETNRGLLEVRPGDGCPANAAALVSDENRDRVALYRTLVEQNDMPPEDIGRVQAAFAKAHRDKAPAGAWIQDDSGPWVRK